MLGRRHAGGQTATGINTEEACKHTFWASRPTFKAGDAHPKRAGDGSARLHSTCAAMQAINWSVAIAIHLLIEGLGIERIRRTGNTGDHQQRDKGGRDGLHGYLSFWPG
jgi:hypothetical protein